jgi:NADPH-dependent 2,4-dienoyl-CoA reductase/sulfur reductase-like enzyme
LGGFLSPKLNQRTDEFGGSLENRTRIVVEMITQIKRLTGSDFPVCVRISADDYMEGGIGLAESPQMAKIFESAGADVISVSAGSHETQHLSNDTMRMEEDFKRPLFEAIKSAVKVPIIVAGGYRNPEKAEKIVADGIADFLGMARSFLADAKWAQKAAEGRSEDIRRCVSCGECLYRLGGKFTYPQGCSVNAVFSREGSWAEIKPAEIKKKVMIVGGGPAGMEAARVASLRGHDVTLYEKKGELGGQLVLAASPTGKERLIWIREYLATQLEKQQVKVKLGSTMTMEIIASENPDEIIVATGAEPKIPDFVDVNDARLVSAWDILSGETERTNQKVVIVGGSMMGCETAEFLAERGNEVSVIKMRPGADMAVDCEPTNRQGLLEALDANKVNLLSDYKIENFTSDGAKIVKRGTGDELTLAADTIVLALGSSPQRQLAEALEKAGRRFHPIGDCENPHNIRQAIYQGALIGRMI